MIRRPSDLILAIKGYIYINDEGGRICVVWINWARTTEVEVNFREGKRCSDATKTPVGFRMDAMNCYVTDRIRLGGTASLMFTGDGTFDYEVETPFATPAKGRIIVKK